MRGRLGHALAGVGMALWTPSAFAAALGTNDFGNLDTTLPQTGVSFLRVLGALVLVLGLFGLGVWAVRNSSRLGLRLGLPPRLRVMEARSLSYRHSLYVVAYDRQRFLVGTSPGNVTLLSQLPPEDTPEAAVPSTGNSFANALRQVLHRKP